jgi:lysozyme family protein
MPTPTGVYDFTAKWEGGKSADGNTNRGVTWTTFQSLAGVVLGVPPDRDTFDNLTQDQANKFVDYYWLMSKMNNVKNKAVASYLFDWFWMMPKNSAIQTATLLKSKYGYPLDTDITGMNDSIVAALNDVQDQSGLLDSLHAQRVQFLNQYAQANTDFQVDLQGWLNREADGYSTYSSGVTPSPAPQPNVTAGFNSWEVWLTAALVAGGFWYKHKKKHVA